MTEFAQTEIPGYGTARYTREALEKITAQTLNYHVPELRHLAASKLARRDRPVDSTFCRLRRDYILAILAGLEADQAVAGIMEREIHRHRSRRFRVMEAVHSAG
jgi:hypothetical protein